MGLKFALLTLFTFLSSGITSDTTGGSTPNELFKLAAQAMKDNNMEAFRPLYLLDKKQSAKDLDGMIGVMKLYPRLKAFLDNGAKKYGRDFNDEVLERFNYELDPATNWVLNFERASAREFKISKMGGQTLASALVTFVNFKGESSSASYVVMQNAERWYFSVPSKRAELLKALTPFVDQSEKFLKESKSAEELSTSMKPLHQLFDDYFNNQ
jgi:hypothetical protein